MKFAALLFTCASTIVLAQTPEVPHKMQFAGMTLAIRDDARREIQADVDMLTKSPKHLAIKAERARTYFPIIEKVFEEERVPDDLKYLVLQESALIGDAVSVSNAVGFWQFKDFTAIEMGLRVDKEIDERMNIVSSSRAAAKYLKKNNYYFNNWLYALQAYQMGAGGVMQSVKDYESGAKHMEITSKTYWYVKKFLAHKIAYEDAVKGSGEIRIITLVNNSKKSMTDLAREFAVKEDELKAYNKWVRSDYIPGDKAYTVAIPTFGDGKALRDAIARTSKPAEPSTRVEAKGAVAKNDIIHVNGIIAMKARAGESTAAFVKRAGVDLSYFLKCNDLSISDKLGEGNFYYLKKKRSRADVPQHVVRKGEDLWTISQQYGVQLRKLQKYNNMASDRDLREGMVLFLSGKKTSAKQSQPVQVAEVEPGEAFNWGVSSESIQTSAHQAPVVLLKPEVESTGPSTENISIAPETHTVAAGETLYSIAKRYSLAVMDVVQWNDLKVEEGIKPGQVLKLRTTANADTSTETDTREIIHQVKGADTLYSIARQYEVTIKELMEWNKKRDFSLTVGENLKILKK